MFKAFTCILLFACISLSQGRQNSFAGQRVKLQGDIDAVHDFNQPPSSLVWPPPRNMIAAGPAIALHPKFEIVTDLTGPLSLSKTQDLLLQDIVKRYAMFISSKQSINTQNSEKSQSIRKFLIQINSSVAMSDIVGEDTSYRYTLDIKGSSAVATAESIYGAQYALESFLQLLHPTKGYLMHSNIIIRDAPQYQWRGLMIDAGRRFFPVPLVENLLDTMAAAKLNVLHLHASDMCRFGVESKKFPNLTKSLTGINSGFYTQEDIASLQQYAKARGIRVVPEFDIPGHSRGFIPVSYGQDGVQFCDPEDSTRSQLFGDPHNSTYAVVHELMSEMSSLFEDDVFNIGCDETRVTGPCTLESTFALERRVFNAIANEFKKTPEGWEEAYFDAQAATPNTIVNAWTRHTAADITKTGRKAVESKSSAFYFTRSAPGGPSGWDRCWYDIATNVPDDQLHLVLGGEMSMWTDTYLYIDQCGASSGPPPVGAALYDPKYDDEFAKSIGGMIWPRGFVGAAAFWNFNASIDPSDSAFVSSIYKLNDEVQSRGGYTCKTNCSCDQLTQCGVPYIKPTPPQAGVAITMAECIDSELSGNFQEWDWNEQSGKISLRSNSSLCLGTSGSEQYPLSLQLCSNAKGNTNWKRGPSGKAEIINAQLNECMDVKNSQDSKDADKALGTWPCGSHEGLDQPNQHWAFDNATGNIVSLASQSVFVGHCVSVSSHAL